MDRDSSELKGIAFIEFGSAEAKVWFLKVLAFLRLVGCVWP